jgi:hypothetical protein
MPGRREESAGSGSCVTDCQGNEPVKDALTNTREGQSDAHSVVIVAMVFVLSVVCAIFVSVTGGEIKMHVLCPLTGKRDRFRRTRGWF